MTNAEEMVLKTVHDLGVARDSDVQNYMGLSASKATRVLKSLERKGYLKIAANMKEYYKNHSSKSIGRISEKRKGVVGIRGSEILLFKCVKDAANAVFGSRANIVRSCNSKTRTAYGYRWMWETDFCSYGERKDGDRNG